MRTLLVLLGLLVIVGTARAQAQVAQAPGSPMPQAPAEPTPVPGSTYPGDEGGTTRVRGAGGETVTVSNLGQIIPLADRRLVLGRGQATAQVFVKLNFSDDEIGEPTTITPDFYYGVTDMLQLGLVHSTPLGWQTPGIAPTAFCITGEDNGCPDVYNNLGIDALALILPGPVEIAGHARFNFGQFDPFRINLVLGLASKLRLPWFAIAFYPSIQIGLNERDPADGPTLTGNKDVIYLPGEIIVQVTPQLAVLGQFALYSQVQNFEDHYRIPLGVAGLLTISPMIDVGVRWAWDNVGATRPGMSRGDERSLTALANFHL